FHSRAKRARDQRPEIREGPSSLPSFAELARFDERIAGGPFECPPRRPPVVVLWWEAFAAEYKSSRRRDRHEIPPGTARRATPSRARSRRRRGHDDHLCRSQQTFTNRSRRHAVLRLPGVVRAGALLAERTEGAWQSVLQRRAPGPGVRTAE